MSKFILAKKIEMTQVFDKEDRVLPTTILEAGPITVLQVKTKEKDGYEAVQVGFGNKKAKNIKKPQKGHFKDLGNFRYVKEFASANNLKVGDKIDVSIFEEGDKVKISGISKGRGFQGGVKRHGFKGASETHGTKHAHRQPGSIGCTGPQRVFKGTRMAGHMGSDRITVSNLKVAKIDKDKNLIFIKGAVPGARGTLIEIRG
ncbi:50S ribosomal protein L3 [Patescibacteria group bacterium]